jgi:hypothetical protein
MWSHECMLVWDIDMYTTQLNLVLVRLFLHHMDWMRLEKISRDFDLLWI